MSADTRSSRAVRVAAAAVLVLMVAVGLWTLGVVGSGGRFFVVETPSMAQTAPVGTLVVTEPVAAHDIRVGDVLSFRPPNLERVYTHRVIEVGAKGLRTQGDLNKAPDGWVVPTDRVVGRATHLWFGVGWAVRMLPWIMVGLFLTSIAASMVRRRTRDAVTIAGTALAFSLALVVVRPLVRAETTGFVPVGADGVTISAVATGLLPIRATSLDDQYVDLVPGQLGWVETHETDDHGRFQLLPTLHLPWWGWVLMGLVCALPLIASLLVKPRDDEDDADDEDGGRPRDGARSAALAALRARRRRVPQAAVPEGAEVGAGSVVRSGPRRVLGRVAVGVVPTLSLAFALTPTDAALTASVTNSPNTAASRAFFTCADAMRYYQGTDRNAQLIVGYAGGDGTGLPGTTSLATKSGSSLNPSNTVQTTNVGCVTDYRARGQKALTLNGTSSKLDVSSPPGQSLANGDPQNSNRQAIQVWFRTTTTRGGVLGCLATWAGACSGRTLFMRNDGSVVWGVGNSDVISSAAGLNDGRWHLAIGQLHTSTGMKLWIDGVLVASNPGVTGSDGNVVYPQWGYNSEALPSGFGVRPTSVYFAGDLQFMGLYGGSSGTGGLKDADVANIYQAALP